jgi:hypothetical protein
MCQGGDRLSEIDLRGEPGDSSGDRDLEIGSGRQAGYDLLDAGEAFLGHTRASQYFPSGPQWHGSKPERAQRQESWTRATGLPVT